MKAALGTVFIVFLLFNLFAFTVSFIIDNPLAFVVLTTGFIGARWVYEVR